MPVSKKKHAALAEDMNTTKSKGIIVEWLNN